MGGGQSAGEGVDSPVHRAGHEHPDVTGGWLRPAVFGVSDGLVSNVALIAGVAGGTQGNGAQAVILAGLAGMAAGAFSMAVGEYVSVASQSESAAREVEKERHEIIGNPEAEIRELADMYERKGVAADLAYQVAQQIHTDVDNAVEVHAREELGVDPGHLASPKLAATSSFLAFALGALVPLVPYFLGAVTFLPGLVATLVALFGAGAIVTSRTNRSWVYGGARQMLLGAAAAGLTYGVGSLVGANLG
jgi:vacuolar iron transporter family protein